MTNQPPSQSPPSGSLIRLPDADRLRLSEVLQELLAHGSILGLEPGRAELYEWCRLNPEWVREAAAIIGLTIYSEHESRLVQAIPQRSSLTLNLKQDATIVMLALWYEFDTQVREYGATQVSLTVRQLNQLLKEKLLPELRSQPSAGRLKEILVQARRFNLLRVDFVDPFDASRIEIFPTLKKVIQFNDIEEWTRTAELHRNPTIVEDMAVDSTDEEGDETT
jgi:hypothetical protein